MMDMNTRVNIIHIVIEMCTSIAILVITMSNIHNLSCFNTFFCCILVFFLIFFYYTIYFKPSRCGEYV